MHSECVDEWLGVTDTAGRSVSLGVWDWEQRERRACDLEPVGYTLLPSSTVFKYILVILRHSYPERLSVSAFILR